MSLGISSSVYKAYAATGDVLTFSALTSTSTSGAQSRTVSLAAVDKAAAPADTVKLSLGSQIKLLKAQGQDTKQIAANVGTTEKVVQEELGDTEAAALTKQLLAVSTGK